MNTIERNIFKRQKDKIPHYDMNIQKVQFMLNYAKVSGYNELSKKKNELYEKYGIQFDDEMIMYALDIIYDCREAGEEYYLDLTPLPQEDNH